MYYVESGRDRDHVIVINISTFINVCFWISVLAAPRIDLEKGPTFVEENTAVTLPKCHVTGSPTPEVKWSKVGGSLPTQSEVEDGALKVVNATKQDAGQYKCEATNSVGSDEAETSVEVIEFVKPPEVLNTTEGGAITAKCHVTTGLKRQFVEWSKANRRLSALPDGTLKLTDIKVEDAGTYVCNVSVDQMTFVAEMQLNVLGKYFSTWWPFLFRSGNVILEAASRLQLLEMFKVAHWM